MSNSARPSEDVIVPDFPVRKLSSAHVVKQEAVRLQATSSSASSKYDLAIMVLE